MRCCFRHAVEFVQHLVVVVDIARAFTGITRRINAGAFVQRVDFDAGVVRDRGQAGYLSRVSRLDNRILDESGAGLRHVRYIEIGLWKHFDAATGEQFIDLAHLAGVATGEHDFFHF